MYIGHREETEVWLQSICNLNSRREWVVSTTPWLHYPQERPLYRRLCGPCGQSGWTQKFHPTRIRSLDY